MRGWGGADSQVQCLFLQAGQSSAPGDHTLLVVVRWAAAQRLQVAIDRLRVQVDTPVVHVAVTVPRRAASVEADGHQKRVTEAKRRGQRWPGLGPVCLSLLPEAGSHPVAQAGLALTDVCSCSDPTHFFQLSV